MRAMTYLGAALLLAAACKKGDEKKAEPPPKAVEAKTPEKPAEPEDIPITAKTPEAVKLFKEGRAVRNAGNQPAGIELWKKAIALDPEFAQAISYLGMVTEGPEGTALLAKAAALSSKLPEAEQQFVLAMHAERVGELAKAKAAFGRAVELAPGSGRTAWARGALSYDDKDYAGTIKYFEIVERLEPKNASIYNFLAYAHGWQREWDQAIAAGKKQIELAPKDVNPHDTLGEVLMWAGKHDEAEKEFAAAMAIDPKNVITWQGVGLARAYRGDFKGAHEAFDKRKVAPEMFDKLQTRLDDAWVWFAEDKLPQAMKVIDELEAEPGAKDSPLYAFAALDRAHILAQAGKYADAAKAYAAASERGDKLDAGRKDELTRGYRMGVLRLAALSGKPSPDADKLLQAADDYAKRVGEGQLPSSHVAYLKGLVAWAKKDQKGAIAELSKCEPQLSMCRFDLAALQRKSGEKAAAEATEKLLRDSPTRDPATVYAIAHLPKQ